MGWMWNGAVVKILGLKLPCNKFGGMKIPPYFCDIIFHTMIKQLLYLIGFGWETIKVFHYTSIVDNTQSDYYKQHGFHPVDTMSDVTHERVEYHVQVRDGVYRVKQKSTIGDNNLYNEALSFVNNLRK